MQMQIRDQNSLVYDESIKKICGSHSRLPAKLSPKNAEKFFGPQSPVLSAQSTQCLASINRGLK